MKTLEKELLSLVKEDRETYIDFSSSLNPTVDKSRIIGLRVPEIRTFVKELVKSKSKEELLEFINNLPHKYFEEDMVEGMLIVNFTKDVKEAFLYLDKFLPYVDNWAVCDTINPKLFKKDLNYTRSKCYEYIKSSYPYMVRFGIVTMLQFLLGDNFVKEDIDHLLEVKSDHYYINMGLAWYYSFALIKNYDEVIDIFKYKKLDKFVHNKSLQKAIESFRITSDTKEYLKTLKVK